MLDTTNQGCSSNLCDLVRYATVAHRLGMGNFILAGWVPNKTKRSVLSNGSHLVMASKAGMAHIGDGMNKGAIPRGHIDLSWKQWLSSGTVAQDIGACYTYPQMGGYYEHESGCDPLVFSAEKGGRPSAWENDSPASGTRVASDPKKRSKHLIQWRQQSNMRLWLPCPGDADLLDDKWKWKSFRELTASDQIQGAQQSKPDPTSTQDQQAGRDPPRSKRSKRGQRQHELRDKFRVWAESAAEASDVK